MGLRTVCCRLVSNLNQEGAPLPSPRSPQTHRVIHIL